MAEEYEPFDANKKSRIDDELLPDLDDAVLRTARMRKNQVSKCKCEARNIAANSVNYYSHVTVQSESMGDECSLDRLDINKYGHVDFSGALNLSAFNKELTSCLNVMDDLKKSHKFQSDVKRKVQKGRFSRMKSSHLIPVYH